MRGQQEIEVSSYAMSLNSSLTSTSGILYTNKNNNDNDNYDIKQSSGIYTAREQRKARTKTTLIKFLLSRNIRSLRNTIHSNEQYVPTSGYCRQNYTRTKYVNSLGHHKMKLYVQLAIVKSACILGICHQRSNYLHYFQI